METGLVNKNYTSRRGELSTYGRAILSSTKLKWMLGALLAAAVLLIMFIAPAMGLGTGMVVIVLGILGVGVLVFWKYINKHFVEPDLALRKWLQQICDGELDARIGLAASHPHHKELDFHTRNVAGALNQLSSDMEQLVETQTARLERQNRVLELLFRLTSDVAGVIDVQSVLDTVCTSLSSWLGDVPVAAYMRVDDQLELQAVIKRDSFAGEYPLSALVDELAFSDGPVVNGFYSTEIPIRRGRELAGMVIVLSLHKDQLQHGESQQVFKVVSDQLSMFIAKQSMLESLHNARLIKERTRLGAEIHDSLAQTLLASRYQITMLRETLEKHPAAQVLKDVERIEGIIGEANIEVRELIGEYRKSPDEQRYADSIQQTIDELNREGDIPVFYQNDNPHIRVTAREDSVIQRIVREALVNAKKYSKATMIRVYLRVEPSGVRSLLIEDDGVGFDLNQSPPHSERVGEHIGLSIMRDRALAVGAILNIDSEPQEGTRISLKLPPFVLSGEG